MIEPQLTPEISYKGLPKTLDYPWDEWDVQQYFYFLPEPFPEDVRDLTPRASWALTLAILEWVDVFFSRFSDDKSLEQYILAGWVGIIDRDRCEHINTDDEDWRGPVRGPLQLSLAIIAEMFFVNSDDRTAVAYAIFAENLARHVIPNDSPFFDWLVFSKERLNRWHSYTAEDPAPEPLFAEHFYLGNVVSRSIFNSNLDYSPDSAEIEIQKLVEVNPRSPFLKQS